METKIYYLNQNEIKGLSSGITVELLDRDGINVEIRLSNNEKDFNADETDDGYEYDPDIDDIWTADDIDTTPSGEERAEIARRAYED